jgi:glutamate synthase (NADPH/NADH) large chain
MVATLSGTASYDIVDKALTALRNLEHRGASGAEADSGDGAGILTQVPDALLRAVAGVELPPAGAYAVGIAFLPDDDARAATASTPSSASRARRASRSSAGATCRTPATWSARRRGR